jgi:hypothetical protein
MNDEIKIRKSWPNKGDFNPATKIEIPKKNTYKRSSTKAEIQKALEEAEEENGDLDFGY